MKSSVLDRLKLLFLVTASIFGVVVLVLNGGYLWSSSLWVKVGALVSCSLLIGSILFYQGVMKKTNFPKTGLELAFGLAALAIVLTWITSPDLRQSLERVVQLLSYILFFYIFYQLLLVVKRKMFWMVIALSLSAGLLLTALIETFTAYQNWFAWETSGTSFPPFLYRFSGILGNSNALMALVNLFLPLSLVLLFKVKVNWQRALLALWLLLYVSGLVFSSSRGGVLGITGGLGLLILLTILHHGWQKEFSGWYKQRPRLSLVIGIFVVIIFAAIGLASYKTFLQHPSHGAGFWDSRLPIWEIAIHIWQTSPMIGIGPGRFAFAVLSQSSQIPPGTWLTSTHQTLLTSLVESGLLGAAALCVFAYFVIRKSIQLYRKIDRSTRLYAAGAFAGLFGFMAHSLVDDFTNWSVVIIPAVFLLAWVFTLIPDLEMREYDISINLLWVPSGALFVCIVLILQAYSPFWVGIHIVRNGKVLTGIETIQKSISRDPNLMYYRIVSGYLQANYAEEIEDIPLISFARSELMQVVQEKPEYNWVTANLATLDWQLGNSNTAISHIESAMLTAPNEFSYPLNLGWYYEQSGEMAEAEKYYWQALSLAPDTVNHPFWQENVFRAELNQRWLVTRINIFEQGASTYWQQALSSMPQDIKLASRYIALSNWDNEPELPNLVTQWKYFQVTGNLEKELQVLEHIHTLMKQTQFNLTVSYVNTDRWLIHKRDGISFEMLPGFLHLEQDVGQFDALERLITIYQSSGQCENMADTWNTLQRSMVGNSFEQVPDAPLCTEK